MGDTAPMPFSAVSTTGIYCRATCVARPNPRNVTTYETGVAAESAGYRPCLRCRPDRGAGSLRRLQVPEPIGHALMLITDGFLDHHNEDALAERVSYSSRQLRRLFLEHVGATPSAIAQSRRAHFARRLIDDTDLDFHTIARAAGFGSARQLHRATTAVFRFPPSTLRDKRKRGERPHLDGGLELQLPYVPPYDFDQVLRHLSARCIPGVESVSGGVYRRSIDSCGHVGVAEVADAGDGEPQPEFGEWLLTSDVVDDGVRLLRIDLSEGQLGQTQVLCADIDLPPDVPQLRFTSNTIVRFPSWSVRTSVTSPLRTTGATMIWSVAG